ncbi:metallophosphoesterase [Mucilaginibacter sp. UR6-11]|uniref:metallophosphoesterase family protein n=1 Tax=Mucilaginibacter sp. UR6-11 TaxID=1435644 RepID=UPI001E41E5A1|nr:metallophosphoesterase [Mucilaginibacter sp. UR6-11]MCC8425055.1 metallophosphoesterase [Mucilaginibacter sp. UR6-11]
MKLKKLLTGLALICPSLAMSQVTQMVFISDVHYGITRKNFRGATHVNAQLVNQALIKQLNILPLLTLPADHGVGSGKKIAAVDYLIETGDIANRMEPPYQTAAISWQQFWSDYGHRLTLVDGEHQLVKLLLVPGNHDISNAIGSSKLMQPKTDPTALVQLYNRMMKPAQPKTNESYNYVTDKINYSVNVHGVHMLFITVWPDSVERIWMQKDLQKVPETTPVIIFCHDPPIADPKHFTNPLPPYEMTAENKFENIIPEHYKEGSNAFKDEEATAIEQRGWVTFLKAHPNIRAYFHGHSNYNEFYVYHGPDHDVALNTFRVDSPMKGKYSATDETKLSFQLLTLDASTLQLTVRECLWNTNPESPAAPTIFGASETIDLKVK